MKIDIEQIKEYMEAIEKVIEQYKEKEWDTDYMEGQLSAYKKIITGTFEYKEV